MNEKGFFPVIIVTPAKAPTKPGIIREQDEEKSEKFSKPILGLDDKESTEKVWFFRYANDPEQIIMWVYKGIHGIAAFENDLAASGFNHEILLPHGIMAHPRRLSMEGLMKLASQKPAPCACVMLLDDLNNPKIHFTNGKGDPGYENLPFDL